MMDTYLSTKQNYLESQGVPKDTQFLKTLTIDTAQLPTDEKIKENYSESPSELAEF